MESDAGKTHRYNEPDPGVWERGYETPHKHIYATDQPLDHNAFVTRAQAKKNPRVRPLNVTPADSELTTDELKDLQEPDVSLAKCWEAASGTKTGGSDEKQTRYVIKNGLLWRKKEEEKREVTQLLQRHCERRR